MLQLLPKEDILTPNTANASDTTEYIESYIDEYHCENLSVDISFLNVIDACYVATACATKHFIKYPTGKIRWKFTSCLAEKYSNIFNLGNSEYIK